MWGERFTADVLAYHFHNKKAPSSFKFIGMLLSFGACEKIIPMGIPLFLPCTC
jgi:hypothetical protein